MLLYKDSNNDSVCSAVAFVLPPGVFITITLFFLAESKSILSTPAPALPIIFNFDPAEIILSVALVAERTTNPSYWLIISLSSLGVKSVCVSTSILFLSKTSFARLLNASDIRILGIVSFHLMVSPIYPRQEILYIVRFYSSTAPYSK